MANRKTSAVPNYISWPIENHQQSTNYISSPQDVVDKVAVARRNAEAVQQEILEDPEMADAQEADAGSEQAVRDDPRRSVRCTNAQDRRGFGEAVGVATISSSDTNKGSSCRCCFKALS